MNRISFRLLLWFLAVEVVYDAVYIGFYVNVGGSFFESEAGEEGLMVGFSRHWTPRLGVGLVFTSCLLGWACTSDVLHLSTG